MPPEAADDLVLWDVLEQHLDEAEFYADNFERALDSPVHTLNSVSKGPERFLLAHVDALVVAGTSVIDRLLLPVVDAADPENTGRVVATAWVLIEIGRLDLFSDLLFHAEASVRRAAARGGGFAASPNADRFALELLAEARKPAEVAGLLEYTAARSLAPRGPLFAWLQHIDPAVVVAAARAAVAVDPTAYRAVFDSLLEHDDSSVRAAVLFPSLLTGSPNAWTACERAVLKDPVPSLAAVSLYAALGAPEHHTKLAARLADENARNACLFGLSFSGNVDLVPTLLPWLASGDPATIRLAAQAIATMAGIELDGAPFRAASPAPEPPKALPPVEEDPEALAALPPLDDDELAVLPVPLPELALPEPDPAAFNAWWRTSASRFKAGVRHLGGQPFSPPVAADFLARAPLRLRHAIAQSIAIRTQQQVVLDTRGLSRFQREGISAVKSLPPKQLNGKFQGW